MESVLQDLSYAPANVGQMLSIAMIEASTGIAKETLRAWEKRYAFPMPVRDDAGERLYTPLQLHQLREAKRLIDRGARPSQIFAGGTLISSATSLLAPAAERRLEQFSEWLKLLADFRLDELAQQLRAEWMRRGTPAFVCELLAPLVSAVGDAWQTGRISVAAEHAFTARVSALLQAAMMSNLMTGMGPVIVSATLSGERHGLGLLMAQAMLLSQRVRVVSLGVDLSVDEIISTVQHTEADVVMLSFSAHFPHKQVPGLMDELIIGLPAHIEFWIGGAGARSVQPHHQVRFSQKLGDIPEWVANLQSMQKMRIKYASTGTGAVQDNLPSETG